MAIEQHGDQLKVQVDSAGRKLPLPYRIGQELGFTGLDGDQFRTTPHWEGPALVLSTIETERGEQVRSRETWQLSADGRELLSHKTEDGPEEHSSCDARFRRSELVTITLKSDRVSVEIRNQPFTDLYMGEAARKPFLFPLRTASGKAVTRGYPVAPEPGDPTDHPHQKGLWVGSESVGDGLRNMDFWENDASYHRPNLGRVVFKDVLDRHEEADRASFTMLSEWVSLEGVPVVSERRRMTFYGNSAECRMFDVELDLTAKKDITLNDHQDAVIGMRLGPAFDEKNGGHAVNAQGLRDEEEVRGRKSEWVDWQTTLEGEPVGVTLMDHPGNYAFPTRWHIRSMGLLVASPFAQRIYDNTLPDNSKALRANETLHLRYRVLIHPLSTDVAAAFQEFAAE